MRIPPTSVAVVSWFPSTATPSITVKNGSTVAIIAVLTGPRTDRPFIKAENAITVDTSASTTMFNHAGTAGGK
jgi:hypothetical protein